MKYIYISFTYSSIKFTKGLSYKLEDYGFKVVNCIEKVENNNWDNLIDIIRDQISRCSVFIAIVDKYTTNVGLELGLAIGMNKNIILICSPSTELPTLLSNLKMIRSDFENPSEISLNINNIIMSFKEETEMKEVNTDLDNLLNSLVSNPDKFEFLNRREFEEIIYKIFLKHGFEPEINNDCYDHSYDIILKEYKTYRKTIVDVKKNSLNNLISLNTIKELVNSVYSHKADCGILVTTSDFTSSAKVFSEKCDVNIELWTMKDVLKLL
jgi:restriction system protein